MKVYVVKDGIHTLTNGVPSHYFADYDRFSRRYLGSFSDVVLVGRLFEREDPTARPVIGPGVTFLAAPAFQGPRQFLGKIWEVTRFVASLGKSDGAFILRLPATLPLLVGLLRWVRGAPFAVELVGDPEDAYSTKVLGTRNFLFRAFFSWGTRFLCAKAVANAYVTKEALQRKYPPRSPLASFNFTSLELKDEMVASQVREFAGSDAKPLRLITVGMLHNAVKGVDLLLQAIKLCVDSEVPVKLTIIGDGKLAEQYRDLSNELGLRDRVEFAGRMDNFQDIASRLQRSDLFVLASRQEGLPRALIEAMAQGLPCISSRVGGVSELLDTDATFEAEDVERLAALIRERHFHRDILEQESVRNLNIVQSYRLDRVALARNAFYAVVAEGST